jgi:hypothetical protein
VLYWSEFYNGKWQPTKTSDINRPTIVADQTTEAFDRKLLLLFPAAKQPTGALSDALILFIQQYSASAPKGASSGFVLFNTHSLPVRFEDLGLGDDWPKAVWQLPMRFLTPMNSTTGGGGYLSRATAASASYAPDPNVGEVKILNMLREGGFITPQHTLNDFDAPFFFGDRRYMFYGTSSLTYATAANHSSFGIVWATPSPRTARGLFAPIARPQSPGGGADVPTNS